MSAPKEMHDISTRASGNCSSLEELLIEPSSGSQVDVFDVCSECMPTTRVILDLIWHVLVQSLTWIHS